jgi:hypothetical protein
MVGNSGHHEDPEAGTVGSLQHNGRESGDDDMQLADGRGGENLFNVELQTHTVQKNQNL